ncbi:MAG: DUF433 domain-containing protein [Candidatus Aenigmarchaeota archaeon]|nr:DUF433 domain-containing protein [Candidatus Aenigmarchaeota archaeon]
MNKKLLQRIVLNPAVMRGKPVIRGTRIPVDAIISRLADGMDEEGVLREFPHITKADVRAALTYSAEVVRGEEISPLVLKWVKHAASG